jgi:hypothetical protein
MFQTIRSKLEKFLFNTLCAGVSHTRPVQCDPASDVLILSQLHHPDVTMYMLAAKSFARHIKPKGFVIVDDGLTEKDRILLSNHFENMRFIPSASVARGACPARGCWERLLAIVDESNRSYVIQLDADTLTIGRPDEVLQCVAEHRSFVMGTQSGRHLVSLAEAGRHASKFSGQHVQGLAEQAFSRYPDNDQLKYVRGCAGFSGFARGTLSLARIEEFSTRMEELVGKSKWHEWGSEQVTSNFLVANTPGAMVLPVERYPFWAPGQDVGNAALVHFFGTFRFAGGMYQRLARRLIKSSTAG